MSRRFPGSRALAVMSPVLLLMAAACSGGDDDASLAGGGRRQSPTTAAPRFAPLTGLPVEDAGTVTRAAVTLKIENSAVSRPQAGLDRADVVFEPVVEGGQTRFLAVFHSTDAEQGGPIRSVRPGDPNIAAPFGGVVAYSGGIPRFVEAMRASGLKNIDENNAGDAFRRRRDKRAPHNLYTSTEALRNKAPGGSAPPKFASFLKPGEAFAPAGATPVSHITLAIGSSTRVDYDWDGAAGAWKRATDNRPHMAEGGSQLAPTTVIVQFVNYQPTGESDTTGAPVFEAAVIGSGQAVVFAGGMRVDARWSKPSATAMTTWTDGAGNPLLLPAGRTWVELPATGASLTTR